MYTITHHVMGQFWKSLSHQVSKNCTMLLNSERILIHQLTSDKTCMNASQPCENSSALHTSITALLKLLLIHVSLYCQRPSFAQASDYDIHVKKLIWARLGQSSLTIMVSLINYIKGVQLFNTVKYPKEHLWIPNRKSLNLSLHA